MPALSFQPRFVDAVESGAKRQTIRKRRKDGRDPKPGDTLYLYTGMRTKACRKLGEARCTSVREIKLGLDHGRLREIAIDGEWIGWDRDPYRAEQRLARADGFRNIDEMFEWFEETHGLPFNGLLIRWTAIP